jgi:hypothetical protein
MIERTQLQIYKMHYIIEQNNKPGYRMYMPTYKSYYKSHPTIYKDVEYKDIDKRAHGWADICIKSPDNKYKYYKFIELNTDKVYRGWIKKWNKLTDRNHFVVIYTDNASICETKYAIYSVQDFEEHLPNLLDKETAIINSEGFYLNQFYTKKCISIRFDPRTSTRRIQDIKQCFEYAIDNKHDYLLHKSAGYVYVYQNWVYQSLSDLFHNTAFYCAYNNLDSFRKAFQRGKIQGVEKIKSSLYGRASTPPYPPTSVATLPDLVTERLGTTDEEAKVAYLGLELNETVNHKSSNQITNPNIEPNNNTNWRDDRVGTNDRNNNEKVAFTG